MASQLPSSLVRNTTSLIYNNGVDNKFWNEKIKKNSQLHTSGVESVKENSRSQPGDFIRSSCAEVRVSGLPPSPARSPRLRHNAMCQLPTLCDCYGSLRRFPPHWSAAWICFADFPSGRLSAICPITRSHCWANGEGQAGVSCTAEQRSSLWTGSLSCTAAAATLIPPTTRRPQPGRFGRLFPHQAPGWSLEKSDICC